MWVTAELQKFQVFWEMILCACNGSSYRSLGWASCMTLQCLNCPRKGSLGQLGLWKQNYNHVQIYTLLCIRIRIFLLSIPNFRKYLLERGRIWKFCVALILLKFCRHIVYTLGFWTRQKDAENIKTYNYLKNLWNNQQMQLYAVNFIPLLSSLYMFRAPHTPIIRSTMFNCIYSHWYKP